MEGSPNTFLCTKRPYADFILEFEVKHDPALNSGVQIRSQTYPDDTPIPGRDGEVYPAGRVYGYQVEISNQETGTSGGIYDEARRGWLQNIEEDPVARTALKDHEWNQYRVVAMGDRIQTWINGVPCADLVDAVTQVGFIGLQVHSFKGPVPTKNLIADPIVLQHLGYRAGRDPMSELPEFPLNPAIPPARVLPGHPHDQGGNPLHEPRPADSLGFASPLESYQLPVPSHYRIRSHDRCDPIERLPTKALALSGESPPLAELSPSTFCTSTYEFSTTSQ